MGFPAAILGISFILLMILTFYFFDRVLKIQYAKYQEDWVKNGKPAGFFWMPKEASVLGGLVAKPANKLARSKYFFSWVFKTPEWIARDADAGDSLSKTRFFSVLSLLSLVSFLFVVYPR